MRRRHRTVLSPQSGLRPGYPAEFLAEVARRFSLPGSGRRLLDLGCGPGTLTIALANQVREAVGVDPERGMLAEAARQATLAGVRNVRWIEARAEDLPPELGWFDLAMMGRSFHWMDRDRALAALAEVVIQNGGLVIVNDNCLVRHAHSADTGLAEQVRLETIFASHDA